MSVVRRYAVSVTGVAFGVFLSLAVFVGVSRLEDRRIALEFEQLSDARFAVIKSEVRTHLGELDALRRFVENSDELTAPEFHRFVAPLLEGHLDFFDFSWAPRILDVDRAAFEERPAGEWDDGILITEFSAQGVMVEASRREQYFPILFVEPPDNRKSGWDLLSDPGRAWAVESAGRTGETAATQRVHRPRYQEERHAIVFCAPVFSPDEGETETVRSDSRLRGIVLSGMDLGGIIEEVHKALRSAGVDVEFWDQTPGGPSVLLYSHRSLTRTEERQDVPSLQAERLIQRRSLDVAGRKWSIHFAPAPFFFEKHLSNTRWVILGVGLLLTVLFAVWLYREEQRSEMVERLVGIRTRALRESEERLELALQGADLGLWDLDVQSGTVIFNNRCVEIPGYEVGEIKPDWSWWGKLLHPEDLPAVGRKFQDHLDGQTSLYEAEYRVRSKFGSWVWISDRGRVVEWDDAGRPLRAAGTFLDISVHKEAEQQKLEAENRARKLQKLEDLGVLAGGVAHDFNNILTGILGNADLALNEVGLQAPVRRNIEEIISSGTRAASLVRKMLAFSGRGGLVVERICVNGLVRDTIGGLGSEVSKNSIFQFELADEAPLIEGDETQIRQIVLNLISNALEAIGDEAGVITVRTGSQYCDRDCIRMSYLDEGQDEGEYVFLEVTDSGCGMDEATKSKMFDPFFSTKFVGRGLGMAAVFGIIRGHGGTVEINSEQGKGSTVRVFFPTRKSRRPHPDFPDRN